MKLKHAIITTSLLAALSMPASAVIVWTGAVDSDLTNDGNWDFSGSALATVAGITSATLADDLQFSGTPTNAPTLGELGGQPTWGVTAGNTITFDGVAMSNSGNDGLGLGIINVTNGGSFTSFFANATVNVDASSSITLQGAGDPIPGVATINLTPGAQLTMASVAEFTEQGGQILVNGVDFNTDNSILSFSGTTATAVPEPTSTALLGLGGLAMIFRRRK